MQSAWSEKDAQAALAAARSQVGDAVPHPYVEDLALRVYTSRLIGQEPGLVLHGGGNTSVKTTMPDDCGQLIEVLCVKGSGWDLATIETPGFPALRLHSLLKLRSLTELSDDAMVNAARTRMLDSRAPNASVEALLHAFIPAKFVDHSHADAVLTLVDQPDAEAICREVWGSRLAIVPYVMAGFELSKVAAEIHDAHPDCEGLVLLQHGLFTWGDDARQSYERHIRAVSEAEAYIQARHQPPVSHADFMVPGGARQAFRRLAPALRGRLDRSASPVVLELRTSPKILEALADDGLDDWSQRGTVTPDHVIRTKPWPMLLRIAGAPYVEAAIIEQIDAALSSFRQRYRAYFNEQVEAKSVQRTQLDEDPRVILVPGVGIISCASSPKACRIAADIYEHTLDVIAAAQSVGRYMPLALPNLFDMEYWPLEQAKLGKRTPKPFEGQVVAITGAASGIGRAAAQAFHSKGAQLVLADFDGPALQELCEQLGAVACPGDLCEAQTAERIVETAVDHFGGLDGIVSNAGDAPQSPIADCDPTLFAHSLELNLVAHQRLAAAATKVLLAQGRGGFLLFNASKAAFNPGPGFGPYAIAKAGLVALMKQYALEYGAYGIRSNAVNADRIRTGLFPAELVEARAKARGLEPDDYFKANLLGREVSADDVAEAFCHLAQALSTTGAILTVDGGNIAASPR